MDKTRRFGLHLKSRDGFSLPEALITVVITVIIFAAFFIILISSSDTWQVNKVQIELQQELRKAMDWTTKELLQAGTSTITNVPADGNWYTSMTFKIPSGVSGGSVSWASDTTTFSLGGTGGKDLLRTVGSQIDTIAQDIQTLQFRRQSTSPSIVEVNLLASKSTPKGKTLTNSLKFSMRMRN